MAGGRAGPCARPLQREAASHGAQRLPARPSVIALADSACGYGCIISKPDTAVGFTTVELKTNFLGTAREGGVACEAKLAHGGRNTQVWDAIVTNEQTGKTMALFRCTQMILYAK
jgi:uncharacterized protein (TIGR00369 family)